MDEIDERAARWLWGAQPTELSSELRSLDETFARFVALSGELVRAARHCQRAARKLTAPLSSEIHHRGDPRDNDPGNLELREQS